jgi:tRNA threonylcarbamoyl adenosine modification protein YeaZ
VGDAAGAGSGTVSVLAIDSASRSRAWVLLTTEDGSVIEQGDVAGGELDRVLPGVLAERLTGEVTAVVVLTGPGSYTGVRAGMAAALGVAAARGLPLHGLGNLTGLAAIADVGDDAEFTVVSDAGRAGVYVARFIRRGPHIDQVSPARRIAVSEVDTRGPLFATTDIQGLRTELVHPARVLAAAVPRALARPALTPLGLHAIHVESTGNGALAPGEGTPKAL